VTVDADFFENKVRPILANSCYDCHSDSPSGGFRLDSKAAFEKGGAHGQEVVAGDPDKSRLIAAVQQTGALKMPKGGKLKPEEVATLVAWVKSGAKWPETASSPVTSTTASTGAITEKQRNFWSFQPLKAVTPPAIEDKRLALGEDADRSFHSGRTPPIRIDARSASRSPHTDPPRDVRHDRTPSDRRGSGSLRSR
jgi:hypothetical protein